MKYICKLCGWEYDEDKEGTAFQELEEDWLCPLCGAPKEDFELKE
ncbi:rubredoxin [bacterium]|nr:rubredoxin [bacterium]